MGEHWTRARKISVNILLPDWKQHGNAAGIVRNSADIREAFEFVLDAECRVGSRVKRGDKVCRYPHWMRQTDCISSQQSFHHNNS